MMMYMMYEFLHFIYSFFCIVHSFLIQFKVLLATNLFYVYSTVYDTFYSRIFRKMSERAGHTNWYANLFL